MRQAVVIIHGIGEQRPMATLRAFVAGALGVKELTPEQNVSSKPDRISEALELRRLHASPPSQDPTCGKGFQLAEGCATDFYELYWQHLMLGTRALPVWLWLLSWLVRPLKLNPRLQQIWWMVVGWAVVAGLVLGAATWRVVIGPPWLWEVVTASVLASVLVLAFRWLGAVVVEWLVVGYLGDASRYLSPAPANIEARRAIRTAGLTLLRGLHEDPLRRYERIIVVGHSLGSVIAYDVITWLWQELHHLVELDRGDLQESHPEKTKVVLTRECRDPDNGAGDGRLNWLRENQPRDLRDPEAVQYVLDCQHFGDCQRMLWRAARDDERLPWRITDLVTLGSPLAHADVLLADGTTELEIGIRQREFPTCPPQPEDVRDRDLLWRQYLDPDQKRASVQFLAWPPSPAPSGGGHGGLVWREHVDPDQNCPPVRILHHGAPFAVTRWTNLYYPGDLIGGPVAPHFGSGVKDVPLCSDRGDRVGNSLLSHIRYWDPEEKTAREKLREALDLNDEAGKRIDKAGKRLDDAGKRLAEARARLEGVRKAVDCTRGRDRPASPAPPDPPRKQSASSWTRLRSHLTGLWSLQTEWLFLLLAVFLGAVLLLIPAPWKAGDPWGYAGLLGAGLLASSLRALLSAGWTLLPALGVYLGHFAGELFFSETHFPSPGLLIGGFDYFLGALAGALAGSHLARVLAKHRQSAHLETSGVSSAASGGIRSSAGSDGKN